MKKLIFLLLLTILPFAIKAQTLEETMDYINANVLKYAVSGEIALKFKENYVDKPISWYRDSKEPTIVNRVYLKDIKGISYIINPEGFIIISIYGKGYYIEYNNKNDGNLKDINSQMAFTPNTPEENVKKIIKAMKHAAELGGAKLIDDDLFKD
jgi:hypothetical protein